MEKSPIFSFFALRNVRVLFKDQRKSEKSWGKRWEFKKIIGEQFRKAVENECFGKISHFLIHVPKLTENLRKCLKKFWRNACESLRKFLRKSEKYFYQGRILRITGIDVQNFVLLNRWWCWKRPTRIGGKEKHCLTAGSVWCYLGVRSRATLLSPGNRYHCCCCCYSCYCWLTSTIPWIYSNLERGTEMVLESELRIGSVMYWAGEKRRSNTVSNVRVRERCLYSICDMHADCLVVNIVAWYYETYDNTGGYNRYMESHLRLFVVVCISINPQLPTTESFLMHSNGSSVPINLTCNMFGQNGQWSVYEPWPHTLRMKFHWLDPVLIGQAATLPSFDHLPVYTCHMTGARVRVTPASRL